MGIGPQDSLGKGILPFVLNRKKKGGRGNAHVRSSDNFHHRQALLSDKELSLSDYWIFSHLVVVPETPIPYAAVRPKTQPRPSGNPDILAEMLGTIRAQRHLNEKRCQTARLGSDPVVIMAILVG